LIVSELFTKLGFKVDQKELLKFQSSIKSMAKVGAVIAGVATSAAVGLFSIVKNAANYGDDLNKTSQKIGVTVEQLERLSYVASLSDVNIGTLQMAFGLLSKKMNDAKAGNKEAAESFKSLGIDPKTIKNNEQGLVAIADKLSKVTNKSKQIALTRDIFGRSGQELLPLLNLGAKGIQELYDEFNNLGLGISGGAAKAAEDFNDNLTRLQGYAGAIVRKIGSELIPVFDKYAKMALTWIKANNAIIKQKLAEWIGKLKIIAEKLFVFIQNKLIPALAWLIDNLETIITVAKYAAIAIAGLYAVKIIVGLGNLITAIISLAANLGSVAGGASTAGASLLAFLGPVGLAIGAVAAIGAAMFAWRKEIGSVVDGLNEMLESLGFVGNEIAKVLRLATPLGYFGKGGLIEFGGRVKDDGLMNAIKNTQFDPKTFGTRGLQEKDKSVKTDKEGKIILSPETGTKEAVGKLQSPGPASDVNINQKFEFHFAAGTDQEIARVTSEEVKRRFNNVLLEAKRNIEPGRK